MKRMLCLLLSLALALSLCACSGRFGLDWVGQKFREVTGQSEPEEPSGEDSAQAGTAQQEKAPVQVAPATEVSNELTGFGLAYQQAYGLHPYRCMSVNNRAILSFLYEPLFAVDATFHAQPVLADSYTVSDDAKTTTVRLKAGLKFSDGSSLTAADVVYSIQSSRGSPYYGSRFDSLLDATAQGDRTVILTTGSAYGELPLLLDIPIIKQGTLEEEVPTGSGPYRFLDSSKLVRNEYYREDGLLLLDFPEITLTPVDTSGDIRDNFEYEAVNLVLSDPNSAAHVTFHNDYELWTGATTVMQYIGYNISTDVFSNYGLRGAVTYALDRENLVTAHAGGFALPAVLPCSPLSDNYDIRLANTYSYSLPKFEERLASASVEDMDADGVLDLYVSSLGYAVPVKGTMIVCSTSYQRVDAATAVVKALNDLGFNITLKALDYDDYTEALLYRNFDLYYGEVRLSPNFDLTPFFRSGGSLCLGGLADTTMENLCSNALLNSGNSYDLYKRLCDRGYLTPILFKNSAIYTTRGSVSDPAGHLEWLLPKPPVE